MQDPPSPTRHKETTPDAEEEEERDEPVLAHVQNSDDERDGDTDDNEDGTDDVSDAEFEDAGDATAEYASPVVDPPSTPPPREARRASSSSQSGGHLPDRDETATTLPTPDTPSFANTTPIPPSPSRLKSVTAHYNAGSNPALSASGGGPSSMDSGSPSIAGAVWRSSAGLGMSGLEEVDLGMGNPVTSSPKAGLARAAAKGKGKAVETSPSDASSSSDGEEDASGQSSPENQQSESQPTSISTSMRDSFIRVRDSESDGANKKPVDWEFWGQVMADYEGVAASHPKELSAAIQHGIPPALRGMTWQLMAASKDANLEATFKALLKQTSSHEKSIGRDLNRTFPKHDYFKEGGVGQESLFNVVKAYSLYDDDVGYTQGLQFIVGPLLLNMPEEETFCVLVRLMQSYDLRSHYTPNMPGLQLRLFQFDRLLEELLPKVFMHLLRQGVKSSMYGSQWFLTLYGYRFPLELVSVVFDLVFAEGVEAVFRFAIAILQRNEEKILELEFEHLIDFLKNGLFEAYMPDLDDDEGLYRADEFVRDALQVNISPSMLDGFLEEWTSLLSAQTAHTAELDTLRRANSQLSAQVRRLETSLAQINVEHCDLVREVVTSRLAREELEDELVKYKTAYADLSHRAEIEGLRRESTTSISSNHTSSSSLSLPSNHSGPVVPPKTSPTTRRTPRPSFSFPNPFAS